MRVVRDSQRLRSVTGRRDGGAAAVEMALVLPVLLFLLMGLIDFGRAYSAQIQVSQAAREGVRLASLNYRWIDIDARVRQAAAGVPTTTILERACPVKAASEDTAKVVVTTHFEWITGISAMSTFFGGAFTGPDTLQSEGVMRCTG